MTLFCECGRTVTRVAASNANSGNGDVPESVERFECPECKKEGTRYSYDDGGEKLTGCLTEVTA
jgi:hypothetical protein